MHEQDIREMGGLSKYMKVTSLTFLVACLAIAGVPPFSGFWSKDEILVAVKQSGNTTLYVLAIVGAALTAFYMFRLYFVVFAGAEKKKAHESPAVMSAPLAVLGVLSVCAGWVGLPWMKKGIVSFLTGPQAHGAVGAAAEVPAGAGAVAHGLATAAGAGAHAAHHGPDYAVMGTSLLVVAGGILLAYGTYMKSWISRDAFSRRFPLLYKLVYNKYYIDEIYLTLIVRPLVRLARGLFAFDLAVIDGAVNGTAWLTVVLSNAKRWFDLYVIDGLVNGVAWLTQFFGRAARRVQSGYVQQYALMILIGLGTILVVKFLR
jgi:NADH-quinone oxidoreductase subunit L